MTMLKVWTRSGVKHGLGMVIALVAAAGMADDALGQPICADTSRTVYASGEGQSGGACPQYTSQESCEMAFTIGEEGPASCFWDTADEVPTCKGCGPRNQSEGLCTNTCILIECGNSDLTFVGPPFSGHSGGSCPSLDNQEDCEGAFTFGSNGAASCYWNDFECRGCGPSNERNGECDNSCRVNDCVGDSTRTVFAGAFSGQSGGGCPQYTDQNSCEIAFVFGEDGFASCFWDDNAEPQCRGCGGSNEFQGLCTNTCHSCVEDPSRTIFAGYGGQGACRQFDSDPTSCEQAYHVGGEDIPTSCFTTTLCEPCGGELIPAATSGAVTSGKSGPNPIECVNTCVPPPPCADMTRTNFLSGPGTAACHVYDGDQEGCETTYILGGQGATSCYYDSNFDVCNGCGGRNESDGECQNTCRTDVCAGDTDRNFAGAFAGHSGGGCPAIDNETDCNNAYVLGSEGFASCFWNDSFSDPKCRGCGSSNESQNYCSNDCRVNTCANDMTRTMFAGAFGNPGCSQYTTEEDCNKAYAYGYNGFVSCFVNGNICEECDYESESLGLCTNTCEEQATCPNDVSRTIFVGGPGSEGCHKYDFDQENCELAYNEGAGGVSSCFYDADVERCSGCGPDNVNDGRCVNTCMPQVCDDQSKAFGPCSAFDGDATGCASAFEASEEGPVSCVAVPACLGCGLFNRAEELCTNTCFSGPTSPTPTPTGTPTSTPTSTPTLRADIPDGSTCLADGECINMHCEQGVCCATECSGGAERCDLPGTAGTCVSVASPAPAVTPWATIAGMLALLGIGLLGLRTRRAR